MGSILGPYFTFGALHGAIISAVISYGQLSHMVSYHIRSTISAVILYGQLAKVCEVMQIYQQYQ